MNKKKFEELEERIKKLEELKKIKSWVEKTFIKCHYCDTYYPKNLIKNTGIKDVYCAPYSVYPYIKQICKFCLDRKKQVCTEVKQIEGKTNRRGLKK